MRESCWSAVGCGVHPSLCWEPREGRIHGCQSRGAGGGSSWEFCSDSFAFPSKVGSKVIRWDENGLEKFTGGWLRGEKVGNGFLVESVDPGALRSTPFQHYTTHQGIRVEPIGSREPMC